MLLSVATLEQLDNHILQLKRRSKSFTEEYRLTVEQALQVKSYFYGGAALQLSTYSIHT